MKVLYVITRSDWGAQAHVYDLIKEARQRGIECEVIVGEEGEFMYRVEEIGVKVTYLSSLVHPIHPLKDCKATFQLYKMIKEKSLQLFMRILLKLELLQEWLVFLLVYLLYLLHMVGLFLMVYLN